MQKTLAESITYEVDAYGHGLASERRFPNIERLRRQSREAQQQMNTIMRNWYNVTVTRVATCTVCGKRDEDTKKASYNLLWPPYKPADWPYVNVCPSCKDTYDAAREQLEKAQEMRAVKQSKLFAKVKVAFVDWLHTHEEQFKKPSMYWTSVDCGTRVVILRAVCACGATRDFTTEGYGKWPVATDGWLSSAREGTICPVCSLQRKQDRLVRRHHLEATADARRAKLEELFAQLPPEDVEDVQVSTPDITSWFGWKMRS